MNNSNNIKENDIQQDDVLPEGSQLLNDPLQENINSIFNDKQNLSSTTYLNNAEVMALNNNTHQTNQFQQPTIIDFFISNNSPNINQSTILGIDNMKQISQSIMGLPINEDINVNASLSKSKLSFGSIENDYLKYENKTIVPQNEITFLKNQNDTQQLRDYVLNKLTIKPDFQTSIGPISSLEHLVEISKGNNVLLKNEMQKKFEAFENIIYKWRKIKGDGNCFYRAIIFRYLELIILNNDIDKMEELIYKVNCCYSSPEIISIIENNITTNTKIKPKLIMEILLSILVFLEQKDIKQAYQMFIKALIGCNHFDYGMILFYRFLLKQYIQKNENKIYLKDFPIKIGNLLPIEYETEEGNFLFDKFYQTYLLKMFKDAEKIIIYLTPFVLKMKLEVVIFDDNNKADDCVKEINYCSQDGTISNDSEKIMVVNRKDHYDLIYSKDEYEKFKNIFNDYTLNYIPKIIKTKNQIEVVNYGSINDFINTIDNIKPNNNTQLQNNKTKIPPESSDPSINLNNDNLHQNININEVIDKSDINEIKKPPMTNSFNQIQKTFSYPVWNNDKNKNISENKLGGSYMQGHTISGFLSNAKKEEKELELICTSCGNTYPPNPKNYYFLLCYNCLYNEIKNCFIPPYFNILQPFRISSKEQPFLQYLESLNQIKNQIVNMIIKIQNESITFYFGIEILNAYSNKAKITINDLIRETQKKFCINCQENIHKQNGKIVLPCGCFLCSANCLKKYTNETFNKNNFYCICETDYGPIYLLKLYSLLKTYNLNGKKEKSLIGNKYKTILKSRCAKCLKSVISYRYYQPIPCYSIKYKNPIDAEKFNETSKLLKDINKIHILCVNCYNEAYQTGSFYCSFCEIEHLSIVITKEDDDCILY